MIVTQVKRIEQRKRISRCGHGSERDCLPGILFCQQHRRIVVSQRQGCCAGNAQCPASLGSTQRKIQYLVLFILSIVAEFHGERL